MITVLSPQGVYRGNYVNNIPNATPYFDDKFTDNLETMQTTLEFAVPLQSEDSEWLEGFGTVLYPDKDNVLRELTIINVWEDWSQEQPLKRVVCEDSSVDALLKSHVVPFTAGNLRDAIAGALRTTPWEYIIGSDTINIGYELVDVKEYTDVRSTLEKIRELYDIEYRFSVKFDGQRITRVLHVYKRFGSNTGKYFVYDRDLINIERTVDFDNIHTAILPYWMEQDVVRTLAGYSPINKINGFRKDNPMDIIIHEAAHNDYDQGDYAKVLIMKSSSTDPELTYLEACNKLLDYIAPTYTYTVNVLLLENALGFEGTEQIHLGDTVWLKEKVGDMELGLEARVVELVTSHNNPEDDQVTFTNFKEISTADSEDVLALRDMINQIQNQQDQINQVVVQVTEDITVLQQGQEGIIEQLGDVPSVSVGDTPNPNPKEGDIWFLDAVDPETGKTYSTIRIWNETTGEWQDRYSAKDAEEAQAAANEAAQAGKDAQAAADDAKEAAQDAAAAGQAALDKANQAVTDAANAKAQADAIQVDVEGLQTDVTNAQADATKALTDSATAISKVGQVDSKVTTVTNDVNGMKTTISDIETVQGETTQKLTEVETNVNGLTVTVGQVKTTADSALSKATTVETTVDGLKATVGEVKKTADGAMSKATQVEATADGLKVTVGEVKTTADGAMQKATQVEATVDGLKTTVSEVKTTANNAFTKATQVEQTANGLTSTVSQVESDLNGLEIGGRNYYRQDNSVTVTDPDVKFERTAAAPNGFKLTGAQDRNGTVRINNVITSNGYWTVSFDLRGSQSVTSYFILDICDLNPTMFAVTADNNWRRVSLTVNVTNYTAEVYNFVEFQNIAWAYFFIKDFKVEKGNKATDWTLAPEDMATASQITQLADQINLKVNKNGVIAQINVSSEGVLIDGKYVHITGTTTIDNAVIKTANIADLAVSNAKIANLAVNGAKIADASITTAKIGDLQVSTAKIANLAVTDAKIGSLSASKITTGTLDAGKISVINLSASSITSGTLSGLTIQSPYDRPITDGSTTWQRGTLTLSNGLYTNEWETYVKSTGVKNISGKLIIDHQALSSYQLDSSGQLEYNMQLSPYALTLQTKDGKGGSFSYNDLYSMPRAGIPAAAGFEPYSSDPSSGNYPSATRKGRLVQLAGSFRNTVVIPASGDIRKMGTAPIWARPIQDVNTIVQGSQMNRYLLSVLTDGTIGVARYGTSSNYEQINTGHWLNIATVYAGRDV
ncbi:phage tail spike protein [Collinsella sp. Sow4_D11]|uniref:phage tail spike protein n=2 Tax=Bacillati TaxID=1783272 RepID=UPI003F8F12C5